MSEWREIFLRDICDSVDYGLTASASREPVGPKFLRITDIVNDLLNWDEVPFVDATADQKKRYQLSAGEIVIARTGAATGYSKWIAEPLPQSVFASYLIRLKLSREVDSRYVGYLLGSSQFTTYVAGVLGDKSAQPNASASTLTAAPLRIPASKSAQEGIAAILGALNDKIAINEQAAVTGEALAISLASEEKWPELTMLGELVRNARDQVQPERIESDRVAHYSLPAFDAGQVPEVVPPNSIKSGKLLVTGACLLLSKLNPSTPRIWHVEPSPELPGLASTEFLVLTPLNDTTPAELWAVCAQPGFSDALTSNATGTSNSRQRVRLADVLATQVVDPRIIAPNVRRQLSMLAARSLKARLESVTLRQLRDTLLPKLMSGDLRVRDAEKVVGEAT